MKSEILNKLSSISPEEKLILSGEKDIDKKIYSSSHGFIINSSKLIDDRLIDVRLHTRFTSFPEHSHDYMEIMYVYSGAVTHRFADKSLLTLKSGDLLVLNRHISHSIDKAGLEDIGINFIISDNFLKTVWQGLDKIDIFYNFIANHFKADGTGDFLFFRIGEIYPIRNLLDNLIYSIIYRDAFDYSILSKSVSLLFAYLSYYKSALINTTSQGISQKEKFKTEVEAYIKQNYKTASLTELSDKLALSPEYLCRNIKLYFSKTFKELLLKYRLDAAQTMLLSTDMDISDIISAVGYENRSYFYRVFGDACGMTPFKWRAKNKQK